MKQKYIHIMPVVKAWMLMYSLIHLLNDIITISIFMIAIVP